MVRGTEAIQWTHSIQRTHSMQEFVFKNDIHRERDTFSNKKFTYMFEILIFKKKFFLFMPSLPSPRPTPVPALYTIYSESLFRPKSVQSFATFYTFFIHRLYAGVSTKPPAQRRLSRYLCKHATYATHATLASH